MQTSLHLLSHDREVSQSCLANFHAGCLTQGLVKRTEGGSDFSISGLPRGSIDPLGRTTRSIVASGAVVSSLLFFSANKLGERGSLGALGGLMQVPFLQALER